MKAIHYKILKIVLLLLLLFPSIFIFEGLFQLLLIKVLGIKEHLPASILPILTLFTSVIVSSIVVAIYLKFIHKSSFKEIGFNIKGKAGDILFGLALGFILIGLGFLILVVSGNLEIQDINFNIKSLLLSFVLMILVAFHEEIVTRGYLLNVLMGNSSKILALIISSVYFALLHIFNNNIGAVPLINIFLAGILLGLPYVFTKNLWFPIAFHFSWNFFQGPIFGFNVSGHVNDTLINQTTSGSDLVTGGAFGFEGSIISLILLLVSISAFYYYLNERSKLKKKIKLDFSDNQLHIQDETED